MLEEVGLHIYIIESSRIITEVVIAAKRGYFYTLRFLNGGAIPLRRSRIFLTREEAQEKIPALVRMKRKVRSQYGYEM